MRKMALPIFLTADRWNRDDTARNPVSLLDSRHVASQF